MFRHISLDFWGTIATPNPVYTQARTEHIISTYGVSADTVETHYRFVKNLLDEFALRYQVATRIDLAYAMFLQQCHYEFAEDSESCAREAHELRLECEKLFLRYPPIIDMELMNAVVEAVDYKGYTVGIISNTNMTSGETIMKMFRQFDQQGDTCDSSGTMDCFFLDASFSDAVGLVKPDKRMFTQAFEKIADEYVNLGALRSLQINECIHVGDHAECDYACTKAGMKFLLVPNPAGTLHFLKGLKDRHD